jgi:ubiquinone/menaquinone biosynthesis C-methylase UbiE
MPLFRKRDVGPPSGAAAPSGNWTVATPGGGDLEWRSYDPVAVTYARTTNRIAELPAADLMDLLRIGPHARILDVGTGAGAAARAAAAKAGPGALVIGIDPSLPMLGEARRAGGGPRFAAAYAIDLPFADSTFTHVTASFVLSHFRSYDTALFDMMRVLRPGGRMGVTTWGPEEDQDEFRKTWRQVVQQFAGPDVLEDAMRQAVPWERRFADRDRLKLALHDAGLRDIWVDRRQYRTEVSAEDYLSGRESAASGRFLRAMLGDELWSVFRARVRQAFAESFPPRFNDFRDVILAAGHKP